MWMLLIFFGFSASFYENYVGQYILLESRKQLRNLCRKIDLKCNNKL